MNRTWETHQQSLRLNQQDEWRDFSARRESITVSPTRLLPPTSVKFPPLEGGREAWETRQQNLRAAEENALPDGPSAVFARLLAGKN